MKEIWEGLDSHEDNRVKFNLPSRLIAKVFLFRLVFGGSAYSYANDPEFASVGFNQKKWQSSIDAFYEKYQGWAKWHTSLMQEATLTGRVLTPTGRVHEYEPIKGFNGDIKWPRTTILNYSIQGLGADLMVLARISMYNRMKKQGLRSILVSTVHDSIVADCPDEEVEIVCRMFHEVFADIPKNFEKMFGKPFNLPMRCEVLFGNNLTDMEEFKI